MKLFFLIGALSGSLAVALGAYGSHAATKMFSDTESSQFDKAHRYHMYHSLALFATAWAIGQWPSELLILSIAAWLFVGGIVFFSGSLYALTLAKWKPGLITPLGGVSFVVGWIVLAIAALRV